MDFPLDVLDSTVVPVLGGTVIVLDHSVGINTVLAINLSSNWGVWDFLQTSDAS